METTRMYWAPRVSQAVIRRLYEADAKGIYDEEVINDAGYALYARCNSIVIATRAENGEVTCPACEQQFHRTDADNLGCPCGWHGSWERYKKTYRKKKLFAGDAVHVFETYLTEFARASSLKEKTLAIDRLIHTFHHELRVCPTSPAAKNLIEGNIAEIVAFLDALTYGQQSTPELVQTRERYKRTLARSWAGGAPFPKNWREPYVGSATGAGTTAEECPNQPSDRTR